jgi:hypothetical protein
MEYWERAGRKCQEEPQVHEIVSLADEGLGISSYLVDLGDGRALAVDPERDEKLAGEVAGGMSAWIAGGQPVARMELVG